MADRFCILTPSPRTIGATAEPPYRSLPSRRERRSSLSSTRMTAYFSGTSTSWRTNGFERRPTAVSRVVKSCQVLLVGSGKGRSLAPCKKNGDWL